MKERPNRFRPLSRSTGEYRPQTLSREDAGEGGGEGNG